MDIRVLAFFLLIGHLVSAFFMSMVLTRQAQLFRIRVQPSLRWFRWILFILALLIFLGNFIPIVIDTATIIGTVTRSAHRINAVGVAYSMSNAFVFALSAVLIWIMYRMAARTVLIVEQDKEEALEDSQH